MTTLNVTFVYTVTFVVLPTLQFSTRLILPSKPKVGLVCPYLPGTGIWALSYPPCHNRVVLSHNYLLPILSKVKCITSICRQLKMTCPKPHYFVVRTSNVCPTYSNLGKGIIPYIYRDVSQTTLEIISIEQTL